MGEGVTSTSTGTLSNAFSLHAGERVIIYGLQKDASYTVTEDAIPLGYAFSEVSKTQAGTIIAGQTKVAVFENTYEGTYAKLTVKESVPDGTTGDRTREFDITV
ncbi:MAG: hypothetical protein PUJ57_04055 [Peptoniphilaceae bacterium]|nr:hypothetical protein [Peptoniphilaceae bacterium]